jgi:hypothetical protein
MHARLILGVPAPPLAFIPYSESILLEDCIRG